ncbi:MAG: PilZ domain-containing protein, partial [Mariprofundaceae bacterium]|nr:PilZ domain-containing protein [Mariprofundaceae bacterium]
KISMLLMEREMLMPDHIGCRRTFERHPLEFEVDVSAVSGTIKHPIEKTVLSNISGDGACFLSNRPESYANGQRIALDIHMPDTGKIDACMEGQATVVWIGDAQADGSDKAHRVSIGISMDNPLSFQQSPRDTDSGKEETGGAS